MLIAPPPGHANRKMTASSHIPVQMRLAIGQRSGIVHNHLYSGRLASTTNDSRLMIIVRDIAALRAALAELPRPRALVATMGALHAGHMALVAEAQRLAPEGVVASIFVNPLQFGPNEDFTRYPRLEAEDLAMLRAAGCNVAWLPPVEAMYPPGIATRITVAGPAEGFEGAVRPGHFEGVATVVTKLLNQTAPDAALFGEKDWQQVMVVTRLAADLDIPTRIVPVPTVRDPDGLALSSRNRHLTAAERTLAPLVHAVLCETAVRLRDGQPVVEAERQGADTLRASGFVPDYLSLVDAATLRPLKALQQPARILVAARLGGVRLLDNIAV